MLSEKDERAKKRVMKALPKNDDRAYVVFKTMMLPVIKIRGLHNQRKIIDLMGIRLKIKKKKEQTNSEKAFLAAFDEITPDNSQAIFYPTKDGDMFAKNYISKFEYVLDYYGYEDSSELQEAKRVIS